MQSRQVVAMPRSGGGRGTYPRCQGSRLGADRVADAVAHRPPIVGGTGLGGHRRGCAGGHGHPGRRDVRGDPRPAGPVLRAAPVMRPATSEQLSELCRGIKKSFVHLETRDAYGTTTELPHIEKWRRGEPDDSDWLDWWLEMVRGPRAAGRTCRRARILSEPVSEYQRWSLSHAGRFVDAGEDIRYVARPRLSTVSLPGSGDYYVFDDELVLFLHYAGSGLNTAFETTEDPQVVRTCREAFETVWELAVPFRDYRPQ